jgi:hypothetical protein
VGLPVADEPELPFCGYFDQHSVVTVTWRTIDISVDDRRAIRKDCDAAVREVLPPGEQSA